MKILLLILFCLTLKAQTENDSTDLNPLNLTKKYFEDKNFRDKGKYLCCELLNGKNDTTFGESLPDNIIREYEVVLEDSSNAVISVNISDTSVSFDWYIYLKREENWKIEAMRGLAYTGLAGKIIEIYKDSSLEYRMNTFVTEDSSMNLETFYQIAKLETSSDKELIKYFHNRKEDFNSLLNDVLINEPPDKKESVKYFNKIPLLKKKINSLYLHGIEVEYEGAISRPYPNCIFFMIGGVLDNTVGYLYCKYKGDVPQIDKSGFIIIKEIGDGWYLYKTT